MSKGVTGKILTIVISLIIAIAALVLLWMFLTGTTQIITAAVQKIINGFRCGLICDKILGTIGADKAMKGMCGAC